MVEDGSIDVVECFLVILKDFGYMDIVDLIEFFDVYGKVGIFVFYCLL